MITVDGYTFVGSYAELCEKFIAYKRSLGYSYNPRTIRHIRYFNEYLNTAQKSDPGDLILTKEVVENFTAIKDGEQPATTLHRETTIRQFALFMNKLGMPAYIAPISRKRYSSFTPYIFSKEQILALLNVVDNLKYDFRSPHYQHVYPFIIRLLYCCGLRLGEALNLRIENIDFDERVIRIEQAKFNNSRLVPMSDSLFSALEEYMRLVGYSPADEGYLFRTKKNRKYAPNSIFSRYKDFLRMAGMPRLPSGGLPRLHDLRHTFSVHALESLIAQGIDVYSGLPYLMNYLGHRQMRHTEYYLRLTSAAYSGIDNALAPLYTDLFPKEVVYDEAT